MYFNSLAFAIFLPVVYLLYWLVPGRHLRFQNLLILGASYFFYGWWDWRFLGLILISSFVDYAVGLAYARGPHDFYRKLLLLISLATNRAQSHFLGTIT